MLESMIAEAQGRSYCLRRYKVPEVVVPTAVPSTSSGWRPSASFSSGIFFLLFLYCTSGTNEANIPPRSITSTNLQT